MHELRMLKKAGTTRRPAHVGLTVVVLLLVLVGVSGCGGGQAKPYGGGQSDPPAAQKDLPGAVIAKIGGTTITKAELNHWMATLTGGDFYDVGRGHEVPGRLASEPPDYAACVASLQAAAAKARGGRAGAKPPASNVSAAQLLNKCHELYVALRLQATTYVVEGHWLIAVAAALGVRASEAEVQSMLRQIKTREYPRPGQFQRYLANSRRSLDDELFVIKLDVLEQRLGKQLSTHAKQIKLLEAGHQVTAETDCQAGYVVQHCRQFTTSKKLPHSPVVLLEQVATITGIPCVNRAACG
jgi:hypothetical protein